MSRLHRLHSNASLRAAAAALLLLAVLAQPGADRPCRTSAHTAGAGLFRVVGAMGGSPIAATQL